jgi:prepilin peptidase CpaA
MGPPISLLSLLMWLYLALLVLAAAQDALTLRISNLLSVALLCVGIASLIVAAPAIWWEPVATFAIVLAAGFFLFSRGWMGGGDVKLFAAAALACNFAGLLRLLPAALLAGGLIAIALIFARSAMPRTSGRRRREIPYGVAIAAGAIFTLFAYPAGTVYAAG